MSKKQETEIEARLKEFWDDHRDFDSAWARDILAELSEVILPAVFKPSAVEIGLEQLYVKSGVRVPREFLDQLYVNTRPTVPRELFEFNFMYDEPEGLPAAVLSPLPIFKYDLALRAYADYGVVLQFPGQDEIAAEDIFLLLDRFPRHWIMPQMWVEEIAAPWAVPRWAEDMKRIITAAQARRKLDDHERVTPDELAALARVSRKSIMNLAAPGKGGVVLHKGSHDQITSESAMRWLLSRPDFRRSIWQQQKKPTHRLSTSEAGNSIYGRTAVCTCGWGRKLVFTGRASPARWPLSRRQRRR
jgi:hypothetical protein